MDADQTAICQFLKSWPGQFVSRREICRRAGGKWRYREDEHWAVPVLQRMLEERLVESDDTGHFRLMKHAANDPRNKKRIWLSPAYRSILQQSGRNFGTIDLDKEPETAEQMASAEPLLSYQNDLQLPPANTSTATPR
ncbi:MAG: hypothetical protein QM813_10460 [Verrucomicrobiota bacterium]